MQYENLITGRGADARRLVAFSRLDWAEDRLRPKHNTRAISTFSAAGAPAGLRHVAATLAAL